jgi:hypothetical protein
MACILILAFSFVCVFVAPLQAAMVGTADILDQKDSTLARQKVVDFMQRQDVANYFNAMGVDSDEARARVATMTDQEIALVADKIDQMPAGGDAVQFVLVVAIIMFIVLVVLDIIGVTDIFTFIKKR